ncbi:MAG: hypothetical protein V7K47_29240 [Nostoc sp.]
MRQSVGGGTPLKGTAVEPLLNQGLVAPSVASDASGKPPTGVCAGNLSTRHFALLASGFA